MPSTAYGELNAWPNPTPYVPVTSITPEIYDAETGWAELHGATSRGAFGPDFHRYYYPRQWVAPNGKVFGLSSDKYWYLDTAGDGSTETLGTFATGIDNTTRPNFGPSSTAVMFDTGKIIQVGGNGYGYPGQGTWSSQKGSVFDISGGGAPTITQTASMNVGRQWANATVLPTGQVVVNHGTQFANNGGQRAAYAAEI